MNQPPGFPPGNGPPGAFGPPSGYGPPPGYGPPSGFGPPSGYGPPGGPPQGPDGPVARGKWVTPLMVVAIPGNIAWLAGVVFFCSTPSFKHDAGAMLCAGLVPHALFTALFTFLLGRARPQWSLPKRIAAGSYLTSGISGVIGVVLSVLAVGLVAAACGGCRR